MNNCLTYLTELGLELKGLQEQGDLEGRGVRARPPRTPSPIMKRARILDDRKKAEDEIQVGGYVHACVPGGACAPSSHWTADDLTEC